MVLPSSGILRSVVWHFCTDVSGQPIGYFFKGQAVKTLEDGTDSLSRNDGTEIRFYFA
jgi:hypothetical protein